MDYRIPEKASVLVARLSSLGDIVQTLPAVEGLARRRPDLEISWLVEKRYAGLLEDHPILERMISVPRENWTEGFTSPYELMDTLRSANEFVRELRKHQFDLFLDFQGNMKSALWGVLSGARDRVGFAGKDSREGNHWFTHYKAPESDGTRHRVEKYRDLVTACTGELNIARPHLPLNTDHRQFADAYLTARGLDEQPFVIMHPGTSSFGKIKRWDPERYASLAEALYRRSGIPTVVTWGGDERELAERVVQAEGALRGPRTRSIRHLIALLKRATAMVGSDTAPAHLSSAVGTPTVALFGPKDPGIYRPYFEPVEIIHEDVWCSPCALRTCPRVDCMKAIDVETVFQAVHNIWPPEPDTASPSSDARGSFPGKRDRN